MSISTLERKILNCIQEDIPLVSEPFKTLAERLKVKEDELIRKIKYFKKRGIIRNLGACLDHNKLGFKSSLVALKVPLDKLASLINEIVDYPEVTHCYLREGEFNLWVVFLYLEKTKFKQFLNKLTRKLGKKNILNLPTQRQFKLKTKLKI